MIRTGFFLLLLSAGVMQAQTVQKINFEKLEQKLHRSTDSVLIFNFWATWCKPCVEELPHFNKLAKKYQDDSLKMYLISLDFPSQLEDQVIPFVKEHQLVPEVFLLNAGDPNEWINKVEPEWSGALPATLMLKNTSGQRQFFEKSLTFPELEQAYLKLKNL